tara:strand:+ start:148 stop:951 length:804 start_codon:yes stop_codon:yes gene_type:complete
MADILQDSVYHSIEDIFKQLLHRFQGKKIGKDITINHIMNTFFGDNKEIEVDIKEKDVDSSIISKNNMKISSIQKIKYNLKCKVFNRIKECLLLNISLSDIKNIKTNNGDTQITERLSIDIIKKCLEKLNYYYEEAGSQQSKDFRNIQKIYLNIEVKKTDSLTVYFNDTLPSVDTFYIIIFTGREYKTKDNIIPKIIFINGYDLVKPDIYLLLEYKKDLNEFKDKWARKKSNQNANKLKYFSVYPRPTFKTDIGYLLNSEYSYELLK